MKTVVRSGAVRAPDRRDTNGGIMPGANTEVVLVNDIWRGMAAERPPLTAQSLDRKWLLTCHLPLDVSMTPRPVGRAALLRRVGGYRCQKGGKYARCRTCFVVNAPHIRPTKNTIGEAFTPQLLRFFVASEPRASCRQPPGIDYAARLPAIQARARSRGESQRIAPSARWVRY
jgi:hypothetical protein